MNYMKTFNGCGAKHHIGSTCFKALQMKLVVSKAILETLL